MTDTPAIIQRQWLRLSLLLSTTMTEALIPLQAKFTQKGNIHLQANSLLNQDTLERLQFTLLASTLLLSIKLFDLIQGYLNLRA